MGRIGETTGRRRDQPRLAVFPVFRELASTKQEPSITGKSKKRDPNSLDLDEKPVPDPSLLPLLVGRPFPDGRDSENPDRGEDRQERDDKRESVGLGLGLNRDAERGTEEEDEKVDDAGGDEGREEGGFEALATRGKSGER